MNKIVMDLIVALTCGVVTWAIQTVIKHVVPFVETKLKESQYSWAAEIINNAVRAFEQTVTGSKRGEEKFEFVMDFVNRELSKLGIKLSEQQITVLIEAAVQAMNAEKLLVEEATSTEEFEPVFYKDDLDNGVEQADSEE
jgi:LL-H family phage holin